MQRDFLMSTTHRREKMLFKDFITEKQEIIFVIKDEETYRLLSDQKYSPIFEALNSGPLTIKELVEEYNKISETPKKQTSIYNYLMELIDKELILKAGQRIISGKTATEVLYSRRAKLYYPSIMTEEYWKSGQSQAIISKLTQMLTIYTLSEGVTTENLTSLYHKIFSDFHSNIALLFEHHPKEIDTLVSPLDFRQLSRLIGVLNMLIMVLNMEKYLEDLQKCFPLNYKHE